MQLRTWLFVLLLLMFSVLIGCGGGTKNSSSQNGEISLHLTDGPGDYKAVYVTIKEVHIQKNSGEWRLISMLNKTFDLLSLRNSIRSPLGISDLPEGTYTQLRLLLSLEPDHENNLLHEPHPYANYVLLNDNTTQELKVPSAIKSGVKLSGEFKIHADKTTVITLDFDAQSSIVEAGNSGQWLLKPVIKTILETEFEKKVAFSGTVKESSGSPLEGVKLSLQTKADEEITLSYSDINGSYQFQVDPQEYILAAYKEGYLPFVRDINLSRGSTLDIILQNAPSTGTLTLKSISSTTEGSARISLRHNFANLSYELFGINISSGFNQVIRLPQGTYTGYASYNGHIQTRLLEISDENLDWIVVF